MEYRGRLDSAFSAESKLRFALFFFFFFFPHFTCSGTISTVVHCSGTVVHCSGTVVHCSSTVCYCLCTKKILKMGPTVLFTHLKIILLQCFQFSVFSFQFQQQ